MYVSILTDSYDFSFRRVSIFVVLSSFNQPVHIFWNLLLRNPRIDLRAGDGGVSHHLGNALRTNPLGNQERSEAVPGLMIGQILFSSDNNAQFVYLKPHHIPAWQRKGWLCVIGRIVQIKYLLRYRMQRNE